MCENCYFYRKDEKPISCNCDCEEKEDFAVDLFYWVFWCKKCAHYIKTKYF